MFHTLWPCKFWFKFINLDLFCDYIINSNLHICKKLGLNRKLTQYEEAYIEKWLNDYKYNFDIIELALKKTTSKSNPNFDYIDKIITDWHDRKLLNSDDVKNYLLEFKNKSKQIKELEKKTGYQNYDQRDITNFDNFYANN